MSSKTNHSRPIYFSRRQQVQFAVGQPTFTMPVFSELLFIMSLKDVKRFLKDSMKSASPLFSYSLGGYEVENYIGR